MKIKMNLFNLFIYEKNTFMLKLQKIILNNLKCDINNVKQYFVF